MLSEFKEEIQQELHQLLDWWKDNMIDTQHSGFYGKIDGNHVIYPLVDKAIILNTRILWTFSAAANKLPNKSYKETAKRAFNYCTNFFLDQEHGGFYWMLNFRGIPAQTKKQIYAQAFAIYALSEYYLLSKDENALNQAVDCFHLIETHSKDLQHGGYLEAFSRDWKLLEDLRLSDKDANEAKTMNTHLHILEAYTNLYRIYPHQQLADALSHLIHCLIARFIDPKTYHLHLFFNERWQLKSKEISFGHDIEASWLLVKAADVLGQTPLIESVKALALKIANGTLQKGVGLDGRIFNEVTPEGKLDKASHWWQPAEGIIGFVNAYQISNQPKYMDAALLLWGFVKKNVIDAQNGEWHWLIDESGKPDKREDKAGPWKAPYHNGRMCMEVVERLNCMELNGKCE